MYTDDRYKGIYFSKREDAEFKMFDERRDDLIKMGYQYFSIASTVIKTTLEYYYSDNKPFIYCRCYFGNADAFSILIVSKEVFEKHNLIEYLKKYADGNTFKKTNVFCIRGARLISLKRTCADNVFFYSSSQKGLAVNDCRIVTYYKCPNIVDVSTTFLYTNDLKEKGIVIPASRYHSISVEEKDSMYHLLIIDSCDSDVVVSMLEREGFRIRIHNRSMLCKKVFSVEIDAWKAAYEYRKKFYNILDKNIYSEYLGSHLDTAIKKLILNEYMEEDIIKMTLTEKSADWRFIVENNLEEIYEKYGISYVGSKTGEHGELLPADEKVL